MIEPPLNAPQTKKRQNKKRPNYLILKRYAYSDMKIRKIQLAALLLAGLFALQTCFVFALEAKPATSDQKTVAAASKKRSKSAKSAEKMQQSAEAAVAEAEATASPAPFVTGSWTLAVLPDTQHYTEKFPGIFDMQTRWIARHKDEFNIRMVAQLGDITQNGTPEEWKTAREAMGELDGLVPYSICLGNHDYRTPHGKALTRESLFNEYFTVDFWKKQPTFGGLLKPNEADNAYQLFEAGGKKWILLSLEWAPRDEAVAWADKILTQFSDRYAIITTHAYLAPDNSQLDMLSKDEDAQLYSPHKYKTPGSINDGGEIWNKLVRKHRVAFVLCGHLSQAARLTSVNDQGFAVHQILSDYQNRKLGGEGFMRLMEFWPDGETVQVITYSPLYGAYLTDEAEQFTLTIGKADQVK